MASITLSSPSDFSGWRAAARGLLEQHVAPEHVHWAVSGDTASLFDSLPTESTISSPSARFKVPRDFLQVAHLTALHSDPDRFALLYRLLWRLQQQPRLMQVAVDIDVARAMVLAKSVSRDIHKMKAFVRFRAVPPVEENRYIAWFEPEHHILEAAAPFFVRRFSNMQWSILTPERSVHWDRQVLLFGPGGFRSDAPAEDAKEDLWRRYYASIFNPARLKVQTMQGQMPKKYWRNLPESQLIPDLIAHAQQRTESMIDKVSVPSRRPRKTAVLRDKVSSSHDDSSLESVRAQALHCRDCDLWKNATQTVFGEGPTTAQIVLVGEQPGDQEDISGHVFVGPAGKLLDRALEEAGLKRNRLYITNAVKHFKYEPRGKRRLHKKPSDREVSICNQWLTRELALVKPRLVVALGATATSGVLRQSLTIRDNRGKVLKREDGTDVIVTVHPSYLLRVRDEDREREYELFVRDLRIAARHAHH